MKIMKPINRILVIASVCLLALYALFFLYDPSVSLVGRWNYKLYDIEFKPDGTAHRAGRVGTYERVGERFVRIGKWRRQSPGGNMVPMPSGLYEFAIDGDRLILTKTVGLEGPP